MILATSFNLKGGPIVNRPERRSDINSLFPADYLTFRRAAGRVMNVLQEPPMATPVNVKSLRPRAEWNDTYLDYPEEACIHDLVSEQARRTPDEIAVVCGRSAMTYAELDYRSGQLARLLRNLNVQPDDR